MTEKLVEQIEASRSGKGSGPWTHDMEARILADAEVIRAAEDHLVKRLKALQTYFDLSDEELESMTSDEQADTIRQHRLISEALDAFHQAQARVEKGEER